MASLTNNFNFSLFFFLKHFDLTCFCLVFDFKTQGVCSYLQRFKDQMIYSVIADYVFKRLSILAILANFSHFRFPL